jgi:hypothetical protein
MKNNTPAYVKLCKQIETITDRIHSIGDLMSLLKDAEDANICHLTAAWIGNQIKTDALMIVNLLDNYAASLDHIEDIVDDP